MRWALSGVAVLVGVVAVMAAVGWMLPLGHVATRRARFGRSAEELFGLISTAPDLEGFEKVEVVPPRRMVTRVADASLPYSGTWTYELSDDGGGTVVRITENGEVCNPVFRVLSRFVFGHTGTIDSYLKGLGKKTGEDVVVEG